MSSGCGDVLSLNDLQIAKKHQIFEAEVITGKQGGVPGGADIDYATNPVTEQEQKTLPAILRDVGFTPASWDFSTGGTLTASDRDKVVYDPVSKTWYTYKGGLPVVVPSGFNPVGSSDWAPITDPTLREYLDNMFASGDFPSTAKYKFKKQENIPGAVLRTIQSRLDDLVFVEDFGAVGDGVANDTTAIQAAIASGAREIRYRDGGVYLVNAGSITCESNQTHIGYGAVIKHTSVTLGFSVFNAFEKVNIRFIGLRFEGPSSQTNAINCVSCNSVTVTACATANIGLLSCKTRKAPNPFVAHDVTGAYPLVTEDGDYNYFITVEGCRVSGDGTGILGGPFKVAGIYLSYVKYATVNGNRINGHKEGIQWWGGDANSVAGDGSIFNPRKCSDITITGNTVVDTVGGIWGSMGQNVSVCGNTVRDCKDVCIDFEGCFDSTASGNTTSNATNGCLTAVFTNRNIIFANNTASISLPNDSVIGGVYNSLADDNNHSVTFIGNTFRNDVSVSFLKIEGVQNIVISGNYFNNVYLATADYSPGNTKRYENITDNTMMFTAGGSGYSYTAMSVGNTTTFGTSRVSGNVITGATIATSQFGIHAKQTRVSNTAQQMLISGNTVRGFINDLIVNTTSLPTSQKHLFSIQGNLFNTGGTNVVGGSANIVQANNYKADASAISF
ncbi:NosD domain-containing protein [Salmonella enterica subsp. enterica serovar Newport]